MYQLDIKRGAEIVATVNIDEQTIYTKKLMAEHKISAKLYTKDALKLNLGDYIEFEGEIFKINRLHGFKKTSLKTHLNTIDFEGRIYDLYRKRLRSGDGLVTFSYLGTVADHLNLLLSNINEIDPGWTAGEVDESEEILIEYTRESCRTALTRIVEKFRFEFSLSGREISIKKSIGSITANRFEYGRNNGLYSLERQQVSDQNIVTRVFCYGGTKNIPYTYRNRAKQLTIGLPYLEKNTGIYGVIEGDFTDENIYPERTGPVTDFLIQFEDLQATPPVRQKFYFEDSTLNFDINDNLLEGETVKIVFKTGDLAGHDFEMTKYIHEIDGTPIRRLYFNPYSEQDGYTLPNSLNKPKNGDQYTLVNISLPQSYVDAAETRLQNAAQEYLNLNSVPRVVYGLNLDQKYIKSNGAVIDAGDLVTTVDEQYGIDTLIRASEIKFPVVNKYKVSATIADYVVYTDQQRAYINAIQAIKETGIIDRRSMERARQNTASMNRLKDYILDQDGYFDPDNIKPRSIETMYMSVGAVASSLRLSGAIFKENYGNDVNAFWASACQLIHLEIELEELGYTWDILEDQAFSDLTSGLEYYLYAKCSTSQLTGTWVLTNDIIESDPGDGFYYFGIGVLLPVDPETEVRQFITTYGKTYINGREITTGRVQSISGENFFDLDTGKFNLGNENAGMDWDISNEGALTIRGALFQSPAGEIAPIPVFRGAYNPTYTYYLGDQITYNGSTWQYINEVQGSGHTPSEGTYWTQTAAKGDTGNQGNPGPQGNTGATGNFTEYQYAKNGSTSSPPSIVTTDLNPSGWSTTPPATSTLEYLWMSKAVKNSSGSYLVSQWSTPVRIKGEDGQTGAVGPSPVYQGVYDAGKTYYGNSTRVDIVKYNSQYYVARSDAGTFSGWQPTSMTKWNPFGANFESVATNLLFASLAYIENLGVRNLKTSTGGERVEINESTNEITVYYGGSPTVRIGADIAGTGINGIELPSGSIRVKGGSIQVTNGSASSILQISEALGISNVAKLQLKRIHPVLVNNDTLFINSIDNKLTFKDMIGVLHPLH